VNIIVSYDSSVTSQSGAFQSLFDGAVNAVVQFYDQEFTNNITVHVTFAWGSLGAGTIAENQFYYDTYSYATIVSALKATQNSADDIAAYATLPANDPTGGNGFMVTAAQARVLGLPFSSTPFDDLVTLNSDFGASGYTFNPNNRAVSGKYDAIGALEHEVSEGIFGRIGNLGLTLNGQSGLYTPLDLFRYSSPEVRDFSPGNNDFFSIDGQQLLTEFNNHNQFGGDVSDWYPSIQGDSFGDGYKGVMGAVTPTDLRELDVLGWNLAGAAHSSPTLRLVGSGNFTAGGLADLAWQNGDGAALWISNGSTLTQVAPNGQMGSEWTEKGVGDFNGDGNADLLWTNNGQAAIWEMSGANLVGFGVSTGQMGSAWQVAGIGDFNGDGRADILWVNGGQAAIWTMNGTNLESSAVSNGAMGTTWHVVATGDFSKDGRDDILWRDSSTGNVAVWEMNGANVSGFDANVGQMSSGWRIAGVGHFSGSADSTSDVVWVDNSNNVQIWQMANGHVANIITPNGLDGTDWHLEGVGNFAGDANSDLLWINSSGAVDLWEISGAQIHDFLMSAPTGNILQLKGSVEATAPGIGSGLPAAVLAGTTSPPLLYSDSSVATPTLTHPS
jgi:FG-GAP-like repeat/FG-GAP repeat